MLTVSTFKEEYSGLIYMIPVYCSIVSRASELLYDVHRLPVSAKHGLQLYLTWPPRVAQYRLTQQKEEDPLARTQERDGIDNRTLFPNPKHNPSFANFSCLSCNTSVLSSKCANDGRLEVANMESLSGVHLNKYK